ncbi:hypothetical protein PGB90_008971 [Kerria lacca]
MCISGLYAGNIQYHRRARNPKLSGQISYVNAEPLHRRGHERRLMVVLPVMQGGNNYSHDKLQFWFTKPPVTAIINDVEQSLPPRTESLDTVYPTFTRPTSQSTESNSKPVSSEYSNHHTTNNISTIEMTTAQSTAKNSLDMFEFMKNMSPLKPVSISETDNLDAIRSNEKYFTLLQDIPIPKNSFSEEYKHKISANSFQNIPTSFSFNKGPTQSPTHINNNLDLGQTTSNKTFVTHKKKIENMNDSPYKLTNEIKSVLFDLGILTNDNEITVTSENNSNDLWAKSNTSIVNAIPYVKFKKIPTSYDQTQVRDDMQKLLDTFGLLPKKHSRHDSNLRLSRQANFNKQFELTQGYTQKHFTNQNRNQLFKTKPVTSTSSNTVNYPKTQKYHARYRSIEFNKSNITDSKVESLQKPYDVFPSIIDTSQTKQQINLNNTSTQKAAKLSLVIPNQAVGKALNLVLKLPTQVTTDEPKESKDIINNEIISERQTLLNVDLASMITSSNFTRPRSTEDPNRKSKENDNTSEKELLASFGENNGNQTSSDGAEDETTPPPNGWYYYVDWNTFYELNEPGRNIRFSPKAGNPRNFIPFTVP